MVSQIKSTKIFKFLRIFYSSQKIQFWNYISTWSWLGLAHWLFLLQMNGGLHLACGGTPLNVKQFSPSSKIKLN